MRWSLFVAVALASGCFAESPILKDNGGTAGTSAGSGSGDGSGSATSDGSGGGGSGSGGMVDGTGGPSGDEVLFDFYMHTCDGMTVREGYGPVSGDTAPVAIDCAPPPGPHGAIEALQTAEVGTMVADKIVHFAPAFHMSDGELANVTLRTAANLPLDASGSARFRAQIGCPPGMSGTVFVQARVFTDGGPSGETHHDCSTGELELLDVPLGDQAAQVLIFVGLDPGEQASAFLIHPEVVIPGGP